MTRKVAGKTERRTYRVKDRGAHRDVMLRSTQKFVRFDCPFCGAEVTAHVWSLHGSGKRCRCGAKFWPRGDARKEVPAGHVFNEGVSFATRETAGSKMGAREVEVFAPGGRNFEGERHSLVARGATITEALELALVEARGTQLLDCPPDCSCNEID